MLHMARLFVAEGQRDSSRFVAVDMFLSPKEGERVKDGYDGYQGLLGLLESPVNLRLYKRSGDLWLSYLGKPEQWPDLRHSSGSKLFIDSGTGPEK